MGLHPQIKHDLLPEEWKEVSDLMAKLTTLVSRFARFSLRRNRTNQDRVSPPQQGLNTHNLPVS
jgi:hypothetical protein